MRLFNTYRPFTDLRRDHNLFSLATPSADNDFLIFWHATNDDMEVFSRNNDAAFGGADDKLNMWHSICSTWDSSSGLVQLWFDGQPSARKFFSSGSNISGLTVIIIITGTVLLLSTMFDIPYVSTVCLYKLDKSNKYCQY